MEEINGFLTQEEFDALQRHIEVTKALDELLVDYVKQTGGLPSRTTLWEFLSWAHQQTLKSTSKEVLNADTDSGGMVTKG